MDPLTREWVSKAEEDWEVASWLMTAPIGSHSATCFHSQQAAEKLLKACLTRHGRTFPRTHDLALLIELLRPYQPTVSSLVDDCKTLQPYAIESRYPGTQADLSDACSALESCGRIRDALLAIVGE